MAQDRTGGQGTGSERWKDTAGVTGRWTSKQLKKDAARGIETPSVRSKKEYRRDMASEDFSFEQMRKGRVAEGPTPKRYYRNFDRGAARHARAEGRRKSRRR